MHEAVVRTLSDPCPALGLHPSGTCDEDCAVEDVRVLGRAEQGHLFVVTFAEPVDDRVAAFDAVRSVRQIEAGDQEYRYILHVVPSVDVEDPRSNDPVLLDSVTLDGDEITHTLLGDQSVLSRHVSWFESLVDGIELLRLSPYDGVERSGRSLTDRQRTTVATAFELGYYEVPREATAAEVADHLDLDRSTVTEHLQRAERRLVSAAVSE